MGGRGSSSGTEETGSVIVFSPKILKQMPKRGWTKQDVSDIVNNPAKTVPTKDTRHRADGSREDSPATAYIDENGAYVVRNDTTGEIVQISNRNDSNWQSPF
ncbi:hypothetical protein LC607_23205 [Nostoc sp. CHAB 5824]|nr:hypothetical protein [Nostoc sp. CHAB 5824]